jgi:hypothetical protein
MRKKKRMQRELRPEEIRTWKVVGVLSLALSIISAFSLLELRPQISVSPQPYLDSTNPAFSTPFRITNSGYVHLRVKRVLSYVRKMRVGRMVLTHAVGLESQGADLSRGEAETIMPRWYGGRVPDEADMVIVVDYEKFGRSFRDYVRFKRFEGPYMGIWQWNQQPAEDIEQEVDKELDKATRGAALVE